MTDARLMFIAAYLERDLSMADLCRAFGVSRKTGYKFVQRYKANGPEGLQDLQRAPHSHPNSVSEELRDHIVDLRGLHPTWGPRKLRAVLDRDQPGANWPATSTIGDILKRSGLVTPRKRRPRSSSAATLTQPSQPNDVWAADFKGHFPLGNGQRCHPCTITDLPSRYLLRCQALAKTDCQSVKPLWVAAFREYGLPRVIRTDNGAPFASNGLGGLSPLSVWWIRLGIRPERIQPGHPEQNGQHERMHRTLKQEATKPPQTHIRGQQRVFDQFRLYYNQVRPHEALGQLTPASVYSPSPRDYPLRLPEIEYPQGVLVRRVRTDGSIRWRGGTIFVSETLVGQQVAFDQLDDRLWALWFGPTTLAVLDGHARSWLTPKAAAPRLHALLEEDS